MERKNEASDAGVEARRRFLATCGKFAIATPPAVTMILSQAGRNYAVASSGGHGPSSRGNNGWGNGGGDGVPGKSGQNGSPQTPSKVKDKDR